MSKKYLEPLTECVGILSKAKGVNYVIIAADAVSKADSNEEFVGGSGWNVEDDGETDPEILVMIGGLLEHYLDELDASYLDKIKIINEFNTVLIDNITKKEEKNNDREI